jgi:hypothetical protein
VAGFGVAGVGGSADFLMKQKNAARLQFELTLAFLLFTWFAAMAISWFFPAAIPAAEVTTETEGLVLRAFLRQVLKSVLAGMWFAGGMDGMGQIARIHEGVQDHFSGREMVTALAQGAIAGGVMGAAGAGVAARTNAFTKMLANGLKARGLPVSRRGSGSRGSPAPPVTSPLRDSPNIMSISLRRPSSGSGWPG